MKYDGITVPYEYVELIVTITLMKPKILTNIKEIDSFTTDQTKRRAAGFEIAKCHFLRYRQKSS